MNRTPLLTSLLWTSLGAVALVGCDNEEPSISRDGPAALIPSSLPFTVECGKPTTSQRFQVINSGNQELLVRGATATDGFVIVAELPMTVQPGAAIVIEVKPPAAVVGTDRGGSVKTGTLTVDTDDPAGTPPIALRATVLGANLELVNAANAPLPRLDLASSTAACPSPGAVFVRNTGNRPANVTVGDADYTTEQSTGSSDVVAGMRTEFAVSPDGTSDCSLEGSVSFVVPATASVCTVTPLVLQVTQTTNGSSDVCFCGSTSA